MGGKQYNDTVQTWIRTIEKNYFADSELALMYCEDLIGHGKEIGDNNLLAMGYYHKGVVYYVRNDGHKFYEAITKALSHLSIGENWDLMARCYNFLGIFAVNHGNAALGMDYYLTAINACEVAGIEGYAATVLVNLGMMNIIYGRHDDAIEVLEKARDYFLQHLEKPRCEEYLIYVYQNLAKAYLCKNELIEAKCCFENIYSEHGESLNQVGTISIWATEVMYYHVAGKDKKCEEIIEKIYEKMSESLPIMDMFDDLYDYCKILLERDKKNEFWKIIEMLERSMEKLDIVNFKLKTLGLKLEYYRKHNLQDEYLNTSALYYECSLHANEEHKYSMKNVLNLRKTLELLNREKREVEERNAILQKKSETDALTGLNNRFGLNDYSEIALKNALDNGTSLALEILDMDNFKEYNDTNGHQKGDECIQMVAAAIKTMEEFGAYTARYGGDEFILIYEGKTKEEVIEYAAELRKRIMDLHIETATSKGTKILTVSQGVCWDVPVKGNRVWDYLHAADELLYRVKQRKRNNFCIGNLVLAGDQIVMSYL